MNILDMKYTEEGVLYRVKNLFTFGVHCTEEQDSIFYKENPYVWSTLQLNWININTQEPVDDNILFYMFQTYHFARNIHWLYKNFTPPVHIESKPWDL